jgi:hypothetical protein
MKKIITYLVILFITISCVSNPIIFNFENRLFDNTGNQVLYITNKPVYEYQEKAVVRIVLTATHKEGFVYQNFKKAIIDNNFDAIIDIKSEVILKGFGMIAIEYKGIGIVQKK